ncbi:hypothetical protein A9R05_07430 [Burkholderia sp. KK1]|nr:hypothetical protein A9R05_07180 [Burkholderia sp. KK1]AQH00226.1 hypothetical protein A9R05_07430 [Burkholderia sp. KK1]
MLICGIDPGLTGAVAFVDHNGLRAVFDIPTKPIADVGPKALVKRQCDGRVLGEMLRQHHAADESALVVIEDVQAIGGSAIQTMGSMMHTKGLIEGVCAAKGYDVAFVRPQTWKRFFGLTADKAKCLEIARSLFGAEYISRQKDHNRAEAMLIARYGMRHFA